MKISFRFKLIASILSVVVISQALGFFAVYRIMVRTIREENERAALDSFAKAETSIDWVLENALHLSIIIQRDEIFQAYLNGEYGSERERRIMQIELASMIDAFLGRYNMLNAVILFREDGQIAGSSAPRRYFQYNPAHPFYFSDSFQFSVANPNVITVNTDHLRHFFSQSTPTAVTERCIIIGIQRAVYTRMLHGGTHPGAVMLVSIDESVLRRFYEQLAAEESRITILNEDGRLFSGMEMENFGVVPCYFGYITGDYGSFLWNDGMIIYYRLASVNWILVKEIPLWAHEQELQAAITAVAGVTAGFLLLLLPAIAGPVLHFTRKEIQKTEREKAELEIESLQNQLRPHFLYNTIASIRWMASFSGAHDVANSLITLIRLMRPIYDSSTRMWTLNEEYGFLRDYCSLMRMRYGKDVVLDFECGDEKLMIPRFILQPIVENCFEHALNGLNEMKIDITSRVNGKTAEITVTDNGSGIEREQLMRINEKLKAVGTEAETSRTAGQKGIGILNSHKRIKAAYGKSAEVTVKSGGLTKGSTAVSVKFTISE